MKRIGTDLALFLFVVLLASCAATSGVGTEKNACLLRAAHGDVYLKVFDLDSNGNMGALVWQGRLNQGQTARIRTTQGSFRYFFNSEPDIDQPFRSGVDKSCDDLDTVDVPR